MLEVEQALALVLENSWTPPAESAPPHRALGRVLAEPVKADRDSPPFDKSMVDGYALRAEDSREGTAELSVLEEVTAGRVPSRAVVAGTATRIMTGAPIPAGADAVVMVERTLPLGPTGERVEIQGLLKSGQNILRQGQSMRQGEVVLPPGQLIRAMEVGLLCEVGRANVLVGGRPTVAILPTGDEVVPYDQTPTGGQIRNTNGPMLCAAIERAGGTPVDLGVGRDEMDELRRLIRKGLECDMLLLSGGVSAGVLDLVPRALADEGVREVFHKVRFKPGKPLWFGRGPDRATTAGGSPRPGALVFGLPGNPVSSLVCCEMFVRPALGRMMGRAESGMRRAQARITTEFRHSGDRPTWHPARARFEEQGVAVDPLPWQGSADLRTLVLANCLLHFPAGERRYAAGDACEIWWLEA